jgi:hypothetical protein
LTPDVRLIRRAKHRASESVRRRSERTNDMPTRSGVAFLIGSVSDRHWRSLARIGIAFVWGVAAAFGAAAPSQSAGTLAVPPDSPRWELEGEAKPAEYLGRKCLRLDGGGRR